MGILSGLLETRAQDFLDLILSARGAPYETATGKTITVASSMQYSAVFAAQRILAEDTASLPLILYRRLQPRGKERATDHRLYNILHLQANPEMTAYELRELLVSHCAMWGNGYAEIQRDRRDRIIALWPLRPDRVDVQRGWDGRLYYHVSIGDTLEHDLEIQTLPDRNVMHVRGLGYDGVKGYSVIGLARQSIGLGLATEEFGARFFGNGARPGAVLEHPGKLTSDAHKRLRKSWDVRHRGLENAHRMAILEEGMKVHEIGIPPEDAQFLETRKFQVVEVARWFRLAPHKLADLERATFSNIEHQSLDHVISALRPWLVRIEQRINHDLLTDAERQQGLFAEHLVDALLRGDIKSRYEAYAVAKQNGWMNADEIRDLENMNPQPGGQGHIYLVPLNMIPADMVAGSQPAGDGGDNNRSIERRTIIERRAQSLARSRQRLAVSYERLFFDVIDRVIRREIADVRRAVRKFLGKRNSQDFLTWLEEFYQEHRAFWQRQIMPVLVSYAEQVGVEVEQELDRDPGSIQRFIEEYAAALAGRESDSSFQQLRALLEEALAGEDTEPVEVIDERLDGWGETRASGLARDESSRAGNAFAWASYLAADVELMRWVAVGDSCPYCRSLNGTVVGIRQTFLSKETEFQPDGADRPLKRRHDIRHGPLHDGCDCIVTAEAAA